MTSYLQNVTQISLQYFYCRCLCFLHTVLCTGHICTVYARAKFERVDLKNPFNFGPYLISMHENMNMELSVCDRNFILLCRAALITYLLAIGLEYLCVEDNSTGFTISFFIFMTTFRYCTTFGGITTNL